MDIGGGYSPRAVVFAKDGRKYIGAELTAVAISAAEIVPEIAGKKYAKNISYENVPVEDREAMIGTADKFNGQICIIENGLMIYLTKERADAMFTLVRQILKAHGGCYISSEAFEYLRQSRAYASHAYYEYRKSVQRHRKLLKSKLDQITAFQSNPQIAGFFLDQWADYGIDFSGLNDENRKSKGFTDFAKEITTPSRILVSELEHIVTPQSEVSFQLTLLNNSRLENVGVEISLLDEKGKVINTKTQSPEEPVGKTSLTQLGICTLMAPRSVGKYQIKLTLKENGKEVHSSTEDLIVIEQADVKSAMKKVCFLDNSEESSDALAALTGPEQVIFTANLSSWPDEILNKIVDVTKNGGKTLLLSDMTSEDIDFMNQSHNFDCTVEANWSTGANGISLHYLPNGSALLPVFGGSNVLDHNAAAVMPGLSLNELPGATVFARSVSIKDGEVKTGVDMQMIPFGKGKIMFNQFSVFEGLETNALADALFTAIVNLL